MRRGAGRLGRLGEGQQHRAARGAEGGQGAAAGAGHFPELPRAHAAEMHPAVVGNPVGAGLGRVVAGQRRHQHLEGLSLPGAGQDRGGRGAEKFCGSDAEVRVQPVKGRGRQPPVGGGRRGEQVPEDRAGQLGHGTLAGQGAHRREGDRRQDAPQFGRGSRRLRRLGPALYSGGCGRAGGAQLRPPVRGQAGCGYEQRQHEPGAAQGGGRAAVPVRPFVPPAPLAEADTRHLDEVQAIEQRAEAEGDLGDRPGEQRPGHEQDRERGHDIAPAARGKELEHAVELRQGGLARQGRGHGQEEVGAHADQDAEERAQRHEALGRAPGESHSQHDVHKGEADDFAPHQGRVPLALEGGVEHHGRVDDGQENAVEEAKQAADPVGQEAFERGHEHGRQARQHPEHGADAAQYPDR